MLWPCPASSLPVEEPQIHGFLSKPKSRARLIYLRFSKSILYAEKSGEQFLRAWPSIGRTNYCHVFGENSMYSLMDAVVFNQSWTLQ